jgi:hypothetical protein
VAGLVVQVAWLAFGLYRSDPRLIVLGVARSG